MAQDVAQAGLLRHKKEARCVISRIAPPLFINKQQLDQLRHFPLVVAQSQGLRHFASILGLFGSCQQPVKIEAVDSEPRRHLLMSDGTLQVVVDSDWRTMSKPFPSRAAGQFTAFPSNRRNLIGHRFADVNGLQQRLLICARVQPASEPFPLDCNAPA